MKILKTFCILLIFFLFFQNHSLASSSQQVDKISKNLRCLICQGQSVYDSQSDFALSMKTLIKKKNWWRQKWWWNLWFSYKQIWWMDCIWARI